MHAAAEQDNLIKFVLSGSTPFKTFTVSEPSDSDRYVSRETYVGMFISLPCLAGKHGILLNLPCHHEKSATHGLLGVRTCPLPKHPARKGTPHAKPSFQDGEAELFSAKAIVDNLDVNVFFIVALIAWDYHAARPASDSRAASDTLLQRSVGALKINHIAVK